MNDNQILVIVLFVSCMLATALICGIGVLIHIRKEKKKEADLDELSAKARAFKDNGMTFACGSSGWVKDNVFNLYFEKY